MSLRVSSLRLLDQTRKRCKEIVLNTLLFPTSVPFTSPDNTWCSPTVKEVSKYANTNMRWEPNLSYTHPESDWVSRPTIYSHTSNRKHSYTNCNHLSFATIESDFCAQYRGESLNAKAAHASSNHISFATPVSDFTGDKYLKNIPRIYTITEALTPSTDARVLTKANERFSIQHVNEAWTRLCGFSQTESLGKSLNILQGNDTDKRVVDELVSLLRDGKSVDALLTNYNKSGHKFNNHLTINPVVCAQTHALTHFIGVLKEIDGDNHKQFVKSTNE